ncbi:MAG TPA: LptF/LptG family permease [Gemmatimonadales bacterium]|jgi:lipopolysaccharide export system permease protein|nr:LptF/LptG family permease [Gemmatimonadales bacterium]
MRIRILDRYVLRSWVLIFLLTAVGFPVVSVLINLTDNLEKLLDRGLRVPEIFASYVYALPEHIYLVMPAAVLFATVFTVGNLGRHSELTAAKAGGQSFHRLALPIYLAALLASGTAYVVGELAPESTSRQLELQKAKQVRPKTSRYNFVYRADQGWVYTIRTLEVENRVLRQVVLERQGRGPDYPSLALSADSATYDDTLGFWRLHNGWSRRLAGVDDQLSLRFRSARLRAMHEEPADLLVEPKAPEEMRYAELSRYIESYKRSGNDTAKLEVDRALKIALPATCLIIALFGAPLAVSSPRQGTAIGIAISLGTTVIFLSLIQLSKAVGTSGVMNPVAAAWAPNAIFLVAGLWLMARVRT